MKIKSFENFINENNHKFNYMMLGRLKSDCEYFLNYGGGSLRNLYYGDIEKHITEMKKLWNSFPENEKPDWLSYEDIEKYEEDMLSYEPN
jgi:Large polyvalent protein-associated domain 11